MPIRSATAEWRGNLREGKGAMKLEAWEGPYSFASRFEQGAGTNPEELIAGAHAGCFSMAFSGILEAAGFSPTRVHTTARVSVEKDGDGFSITKSHLITEADVPGIDEAAFQKHASEAKEGCPVSRALAGVEITLEARLA